MTLLHVESFDTLDFTNLADVLERYEAAATAAIWNNTGAGRNGTYGAGFTFGTYLERRPGISKATYITGFAFNAASNAVTERVFELRDAGTAQAYLAFDGPSGKLRACRGDGTLLGESSLVLAFGNWYYVEAKITISNAAGVFVIRVNGQTVLNLAAVDTQVTANATADQYRLEWSPNAADVAYFDDWYVCDDAGVVNNDFLGDVTIRALLPTGAGSNTTWTPSAGVNWQNVDEVPPTEDTDYNSSATVGQIDTYAMADLPAALAGTIKGVVASLVARKDDAGARSIREKCKSGVTTASGATQVVTTSYFTYREIRELDPNTAAAWTKAAVDAAEFGVEVMA